MRVLRKELVGGGRTMQRQASIADHCTRSGPKGTPRAFTLGRMKAMKGRMHRGTRPDTKYRTGDSKTSYPGSACQRWDEVGCKPLIPNATHCKTLQPIDLLATYRPNSWP